VAYASKDFLNATLGAPDWDATAQRLNAVVDKAVQDEKSSKAIKKDVSGLADELKKWTPGYGAVSAYSVRTADGYEAFWHDFGDHSGCKGVKTHLFEHVRGEPIFGMALGTRDPGPAYATFSKYFAAFYGHAEDAFLAWQIDDEYKKEYRSRA